MPSDLECFDRNGLSFSVPILFSTAALVLSIGNAYVTYRQSCVAYRKSQDKKNIRALQKWQNLVEIYYPDCDQEILSIYEAAGLIPLIINALHDAPADKVLAIVNGIVQQILAAPTMQDTFKTDIDGDINLIEMRLKYAYLQAGLNNKPMININRLKKLLSQPLSLDNSMPDKTLRGNALIQQIRKNLNKCIEQEFRRSDVHSALSVLSCLAQDLNAIHQAYADRIIMHTVSMDITEFFKSDNEDEVAQKRKCF